MAIFRKIDSSTTDRSVKDRLRHRQKIKEALRKNISDIIADEAIIGKDKDQIIKVPIRGIKEYRFIFDRYRSRSIAQGDGKTKRGQIVSSQGNGKASGGAKPGNEPGEDVYEVETTIEEIVDVMFEDLKLPDLFRKKIQQIKTDQVLKRQGYRKKGIRPRLSEERTYIARLERKKAMQYKKDRGLEKDKSSDSIPFSMDDMRYRFVEEKERKHSNAAVIFIMDVSGSMDISKKYLARAFFFLLYHFIKIKYDRTELIFISHHTEAREVDENDFFHKGESGGTNISSGYAKAIDIINSRYNPSAWNAYAFHCSDGENFSDDNEKAVELAEKLCVLCNLFGYIEINPNVAQGNIVSGGKRQVGLPFFSDEKIISIFKSRIKSENFSAQILSDKSKILDCFRMILKKEWGE